MPLMPSAQVTLAVPATAGVDGWVDDTKETWTFASATTFTVATDLTAKYTKGTRIKLTQTTVKFFVATAAPTFGGGNTTVTISGGTDYTFTNAAVSANYHSYEANPQGYPTSFNFTPSFTGFSANPTGFICWFAVLGSVCHYELRSPSSGTSNATSLTVSAPIPSAETPLISARGVDNSANLVNSSLVAFATAGATITAYKDLTGAAWTGSGTKNIEFTISYRI